MVLVRGLPVPRARVYDERLQGVLHILPAVPDHAADFQIGQQPAFCCPIFNRPNRHVADFGNVGFLDEITHGINVVLRAQRCPLRLVGAPPRHGNPQNSLTRLRPISIKLVAAHQWPRILKPKPNPDCFASVRLRCNHDTKKPCGSAWRFHSRTACGVWATFWAAFTTLRAADADSIESASTTYVLQLIRLV